MSTFKFTLPNGKPFELKGPPGFSFDQAKAVFDKQAATGSLVGMLPGGTLSAATQAAQGLAGAQSIVAQAQSGITGALGAGIPGAAGAIGSVSSGLAAAGGALRGSLAGIASGLTGAVGAASALAASSSVATSGAGASAAIGTINRTIASQALVDPINIADFAKQASALTAIAPMTQAETTGVLAQAKKLVNQGADILSTEKGLGTFGLGAEQLEKAGILKPGMSKFVVSGASSLANLLKSPAAFTGKDAIKSAGDLLANLPKQELIQQDLMKNGLAGLNALGVPPLALSAVGAAGAALNSAVSPEQAANFLKGIPVVGDRLAEKFTANTRDGAFAAVLSKDKIPAPFKAEVIPVPSADTVNRDTVDAASIRVIGNPKVPEPTYTAQPVDEAADEATGIRILELLDAGSASANRLQQRIEALKANVTALENQQTITEQQWIIVESELSQLRSEYNASGAVSFREAADLFNASSERLRRALIGRIRSARGFIDFLIPDVQSLKQRIIELSKKREGIAVSGSRGE